MAVLDKCKQSKSLFLELRIFYDLIHDQPFTDDLLKELINDAQPFAIDMLLLFDAIIVYYEDGTLNCVIHNTKKYLSGTDIFKYDENKYDFLDVSLKIYRENFTSLRH